MWRRQWHPTPALLPGKSHGQRSLVGYSPWGLDESDTTERLHFHFSLSCIGEGNGNPLQCSCLEDLRDGRAWWAAVYGVAHSRTWLKRLSIAFINGLFHYTLWHLTVHDWLNPQTLGSPVKLYTDFHLWAVWHPSPLPVLFKGQLCV